MEAFIFSLNAISPIVILVALGYVLKKIGFMPSEFSKKANTIVFRVCLPAMLFLNVYKIETLKSFDYTYIVYTVLVVLVIFLIGLYLIRFVTKSNASRGALLQSTFRSNFALIGLPLAQALFGEEGVAVSALLSAVIIPSFNFLAVLSLSVYSKDSKAPSLKGILHSVVTNPLIMGVFAGGIALLFRALFERFNIAFRLSDITPIYTVLGYLSNMATPLSLLVIGAQFEFKAVSGLKKEIIFGTVTRSVIVPIIGLGLAYLLYRDSFTGAHFAALVAVFATPVAVSSVPMAQEMNSDVVLAGQLVIFTTIASFFTVGVAAFLLKLAGIF